MIISITHLHQSSILIYEKLFFMPQMLQGLTGDACFVNLNHERILLFRDGGGTDPMKPSNLTDSERC